MEQSGSHTWEQRMGYIVLAYRDGQLLDALSAGERDAHMRACMDHEQALRQSGHLYTVAGVQDGSTAIRVQVADGKLSITDGPYAEMQGQLSQLFFINAHDLNEVIRLASKMPQARAGSIVILPALPFDQRRP
jgi:hypothetical protein